jgi:hypothetical protein
MTRFVFAVGVAVLAAATIVLALQAASNAREICETRHSEGVCTTLLF